MKAEENLQETGQVAAAASTMLADPHQKGPLTTPVGRLIERASYLDLALAGALTILLSTAYFSVAPFNHSLGEKSTGVLDAAYFSFVTFTSLGYGELSPHGLGRVIAIVVVLVGLALIALLVGKFASERQHSLLLLLHSSDCQRRLNEFTNELASLAEQLRLSAQSGNLANTQVASKALSHRIEVVTNYLVFNAHQARLIEFGNESSLLALYVQLSKIQRFCIGVHKAEASDLLVSRRTRSISKRCHSLIQLMRTFHDHAEQKTSYSGALLKLAMKTRRVSQSIEPSSLSKRIASIHDAMTAENKILEHWSHSVRTPILMEEVWLLAPFGRPSTWPKGVHKAIAKSLSISNSLAQVCLDELLKSGRLPKKKDMSAKRDLTSQSNGMTTATAENTTVRFRGNVRIQRESLRKPSALDEGRACMREEPMLDTWLTRASSLSQPLLLCLAVFGYFYTVLPVYQKELLSEQIAAREIELTRVQRAIDATGPTIQRLASERAMLETQLRSLQTQRAAAERHVAQLNARQSILEVKNKELDASRAKLTEEFATVQANAKDFSRRAYHDSFANSVIFQYLRGVSDPYKIVESPKYEAIAAYLMTPFDAVSSTLALGDSKFIESAASVPREVKDEYHAQIRAALESQKESLARSQDDVNALLIHIKESLAGAAVDPTPTDQFNELLFETKARLVKILQDSRQREWDRTRKFLESVAPRGTK